MKTSSRFHESDLKNRATISGFDFHVVTSALGTIINPKIAHQLSPGNDLNPKSEDGARMVTLSTSLSFELDHSASRFCECVHCIFQSIRCAACVCSVDISRQRTIIGFRFLLFKQLFKCCVKLICQSLKTTCPPTRPPNICRRGADLSRRPLRSRFASDQ